MFSKDISAAYEPEIKAEGKNEGLCSGFLEFVDAGLGSECGHCHCQQEGVKVVDGINECCRQKIERVEADDSEEAY